MRRLNIASTLRAVYDNGPIATGPLQSLTGLSRRTLEVIINDLAAQGWIDDTVPTASSKRGAGRPARSLSFNWQAGYVAAVQLDFGYMIAQLADLSGSPVSERRSDLSNALSREDRIAHLFNEVDLLLTEAAVERGHVLAVAVATPGIVRDNGTIDLPATFLDWSDFPLRSRLEEGFDCPVQVENDSNLAALGEVALAGEDPDANFIWVRADGVRIGLGIVINGQLYRGADGAAGEIVWAPALNFEAVQDHVLSGLVHPDHPRSQEAHEIIRLSREGDAMALAEIDSLAAGMAPGLQTLAWILAPQEIVIGGVLGTLDHLLVDALGRRLFAQPHPVEARLRTSASSERAIIAGAIQTALGAVKRTLFSGLDLQSAPIVRQKTVTGDVPHNETVSARSV
ncbi:ROK family protein [Paenarthrobacter sp. NPDC089316]